LFILAGLELDRMVLLYVAVADSARAGVRYAITHGSDRSGTGVDASSGPADNPAQVVTVIKNFASTGILNTAALTSTCTAGSPGICVSYPAGTNGPGSLVKVSVIYTYDPFTVLPFGVNLSSTTQGIITY
jgi:hypothetical protein